MNPEYFIQLVQTSKEYKGYTYKSVNTSSQNILYYFINESHPDFKSYYLKFFSNKPDEMGELSDLKIQRELTISRVIRENLGMYTPESIYLGKDDLGYSALLQEEIRGLTFDVLINGYGNLSPEKLRTIACEMGVCLFRINELSSSYFGDVCGAADRFSNWADCFTQDTTKRLKVALNKGILNQGHVDYFERMLSDTHLKRDVYPPSLCHCDFNPQNIIVDPDTNKIAGIIDFEFAKYWIPAWDLVRVNAAFEYQGVNNDLRNGFFKGYSSSGRMNTDEIKLQINYYKPFESLNYWIWGWEKPRVQDDIKEDIKRVTGIPR